MNGAWPFGVLDEGDGLRHTVKAATPSSSVPGRVALFVELPATTRGSAVRNGEK